MDRFAHLRMLPTCEALPFWHRCPSRPHDDSLLQKTVADRKARFRNSRTSGIRTALPRRAEASPRDQRSAMNADPKVLQQLPTDIGISQQASPMVVSRPDSRGENSRATSSDRRTDQIAEEEYVKLVQRVFLRPTADTPRVVVFSGIDPGNGCTRVCRKTAEVLA